MPGVTVRGALASNVPARHANGRHSSPPLGTRPSGRGGGGPRGAAGAGAAGAGGGGGARGAKKSPKSSIVALTLQGVWKDDDIVPPITPYFVMKVGHVPLIPYQRPGASAAADLVAASIARFMDANTPIRAVMLSRLGPVAWHRTPEEASAVLEELEETARLWLECDRKAEPLNDAHIQELRDAFGARW